MLKTILKKIAHVQSTHPFIVVFILLLFTIGFGTGVAHLQTVASLEQMMPKDIEEIKAFHTLRDNVMGQDSIAIVLSIDRESVYDSGIVDIRDPIVREYVENIHTQLQRTTDVASVQSMVTGPADQFINDDFSKTIIIVMSDVGADDARMQDLAVYIQELLVDMGKPNSLNVDYTGTPIIQQKLGELISADRSNTQWISTLLVFIITAIVFSSISSAFAPIIVVSVSVTWLYSTMGYGGLPISTLAGGVAAMVIGIGIDFAIHIINKFKYERKKGYSINEAIEQAVVDTGSALIATSLTTISAFLAFMVGQMPEMGRFGVLMAIGISFSLLFSIFGLPALLVLEEKLIYFIKKRLRFGLEHEMRLTNDRRNS